MTGSENGGSNKQATGNNVQEEANIYEDDINLIDYFFVLWKHKWLILLGSVLPALIVELIFFFTPRSYEITYVYDVRNDIRNDVRDDVRDDVRNDIRDDVRNDVSGWNLNEKNYNVFVIRFYSEENLNKIANKLRENGLNEYAGSVVAAGSNPNGLRGLLKFEPVPSYIDLSKANITDTRQLEQIRKLTAQLLRMTIVGGAKEKLLNISSVIRDNLEKVIPVYMIQKQLSDDIRTYKMRMADIESNKFGLELTLKTNRNVLEKFQKMKGGYPDRVEGEVVLQFDVGSKSEYLPLKYQMQAVESQLIQLEKQIAVNEAKYKYYENLLALNQKLFAELKNNVSSYYTIQQFHSYLTELVASYETKELKDYLASYIKRIENRISISTPVSENPKMYSIAKGTVKKSGLVFVVALMISIFVSFLLEGLKKARLRFRKN